MTKVELQVISKLDFGRVFSFDQGDKTLVGRGVSAKPEYRTHSDDRSVSREHCVISVKNGDCFIEEIKSQFGLKIGRETKGRNNGVYYKKYPTAYPDRLKLFDGDLLKLGDLTELKVAYDRKQCKYCKHEMQRPHKYCRTCGVNNEKNVFGNFEFNESLEEEDDNKESLSKEEQELDKDELKKREAETNPPIYDDNNILSSNGKKIAEKLSSLQCTSCKEYILGYFNFCPYCDGQNSNKVHIPCRQCEIQFRNASAICPACKHQNPTTREGLDSKDFLPVHNANSLDGSINNDMEKQQILSRLWSLNYQQILKKLSAKKKLASPSYDNSKKNNDNRNSSSSNYSKQYYKEYLKEIGATRRCLSNKLNDAHREPKMNLNEKTIIEVCDDLWHTGVISEAYLDGPDPCVGTEGERDVPRVYYIIDDDKYKEITAYVGKGFGLFPSAMR